VVHDGFANLVLVLDNGVFAKRRRSSRRRFKCPAEGSEFAGIVATLMADRVVYSFAIRGERIELLGMSA